MSDWKETAKKFLMPTCMNRPCCMNAECVAKGESDNPQSFEIIYKTQVLGYVGYVPMIGDSIFGYTVWEVDYKHRYAYVDD